MHPAAERRLAGRIALSRGGRATEILSHDPAFASLMVSHQPLHAPITGDSSMGMWLHLLESPRYPRTNTPSPPDLSCAVPWLGDSMNVRSATGLLVGALRNDETWWSLGPYVAHDANACFEKQFWGRRIRGRDHLHS